MAAGATPPLSRTALAKTAVARQLLNDGFRYLLQFRVPSEASHTFFWPSREALNAFNESAPPRLMSGNALPSAVGKEFDQPSNTPLHQTRRLPALIAHARDHLAT